MGWAGISPSIPQRLARGPLRTGDQLYFPVSVLVYLATPTSILLTRMPLGGWPCQTSTLQPLHRNGVLWGRPGPLGSLLTPAGVPANTSTALQSLVGCLPAFSTLSSFSSQRTTSSSGPVVPPPPPRLSGGGGVEDYQGLILTLYPVWPSGLVVAAGLRFVMLGWGKYLRLFWGLVWPRCPYNLPRWNWLPEGSAGEPVTLPSIQGRVRAVWNHGPLGE